MRIIKPLSIFILWAAFATFTYGQENASFSYFSPLPDANYINPEQVISFRCESGISPQSYSPDLIEITGTKSGPVTGDIRFLDHNHLVNFIPARYFEYGETITVKIHRGLTALNGKEIEPVEYAFNISSNDNLPLLKKYYSSQDCDFYPLARSGSWTSQNGQNGHRDYHLPPGFIQPEVIDYGGAEDGYIFSTFAPLFTQKFDPYITIHDNYGTPVYFKKVTPPSIGLDFKIMPDGKLVYGEWNVFNPAVNLYILMDSAYHVLDTVLMGNGYYLDSHDILLMPDDHYLLMSYDPQLVDMSQVVPGGDTNATVIGLVLQEVDLDRNVYFQWRSWDHFEITDATEDIDLTAEQIDYVHCNAFDFDENGNIVISNRNMDEITKIKYPEGDIIWRLGLLAKNNMFGFTNDTVGFSHQHDIRMVAPGHYTVYDNGNLHNPPHSRPVEYLLDEGAMTATLEYTFTHDSAIFAPMTGSYRQLENGNSLICWGGIMFTSVGISEVTPDGDIALEFYYPDSTFGYRAMRFDWKTTRFSTNVETINWGEFTGYTPIPRIFKVRNHSDEPLVITGIYNRLPSYSASVQLPLTIDPQGEANITVNFFPAGPGEHNDVLTIYSDNADTTERVARQVYLRGYSSTGVEENPSSGGVSVHPNPSNGLFFLEFNKSTPQAVNVYDHAGREVIRMDEPSGDKIELNLEDYPSGIYFVEVWLEGHSKVITSKVMKR